MSYPALVFPAKVTRDRCLSAESYVSAAWVNSQQGWRPAIAVPGSENVGTLDLSASNVRADVDHLVEITTEGELGTARYRVSLDGGATWYGRSFGSTWRHDALALTSDARAASSLEQVPVGVGKARAVFATVHQSTHKISVWYTESLTYLTTLGDPDSVLLKADIATGDAYTQVLRLKRRDKRLFIWYMTASGIYLTTSGNWGATWTTPALAISDTDESVSTVFDVALLRSSKFAICYAKSSGTFHQLYVRTTADGSTHSAAVRVTDNTGNVKHPSLVQRKGTTYFIGNKPTTGLVGRKVTAEDPGAAATGDFSAWTTLPTPSTGHIYPSLALMPHGGIGLAIGGTSGGNPHAWYVDSAAADLSGSMEDNDFGSATPIVCLSNLAGMAVVTINDGTTQDGYYFCTRYWAAVSATAVDSWTGASAQAVPVAADNSIDVLYRFAPGRAYAGDSWSVDTEYANGKEEAWALSPARSSRAIDGAYAYRNSLDAGAYNFLRADTALVRANVDAVTLEMDSAATYTTSPLPASAAISYLYRTLSSCTFPGGGRIHKAGAALVEGVHRGDFARLDDGSTYEIADNSEEDIYVADTDLSAKTGGAKILRRSAWVSFTEAATRYARLSVAAQTTAAGYVELSAAVLGIRMNLPSAACPDATGQALDRYRLPSNETFARRAGPVKREFKLHLAALTVAEQDQLRAALEACDYGAVPFAIIPDVADPFDYELVTVADQAIAWDQDETIITLVGV